MGSSVGWVAADAVPTAGNVGSITPATLDATLSCGSKTSSSQPTVVTAPSPGAADHARASAYASNMLRLSDRGKAVLTDLRTPGAIAAGKHPGKPHLRKRVGSGAGAKHPRIGTCRLAGERRRRVIIGGSDKTPGQCEAAERAVDRPHDQTIASAGALAAAKFDVLGSDQIFRSRIIPRVRDIGRLRRIGVDPAEG